MDNSIPYTALGMNISLMFVLYLKIIKYYNKFTFFNIIFIVSIIFTFFEQVTTILFTENIQANFTLPLNSILFFFMIQNCNWIYYYRSIKIFSFNNTKKIKYLLFIPPFIVLICQLLDLSLFYSQYYNVILPQIFNIDSSITIIIEIITELILYSHVFINIFKIKYLKEYFMNKRVLIKYSSIIMFFLTIDLLVIITAYNNQINISLNYKSTGYLIRYYLIIKLFTEISKIIDKNNITKSTDSNSVSTTTNVIIKKDDDSESSDSIVTTLP